MIAAVISACTSAASPPETAQDFAIYLIKPGSSNPHLNLSQFELEPTPFLSVDEITTCTWETHAVVLTSEARQRVAQLEVA